MKRQRINFFDVTLWGLVLYLLLHVPLTEMRLNVDEMHTIQTTNKEPQPSTKKPEAEEPPVDLKYGKCFHYTGGCEEAGKCRLLNRNASLYCCNVTSPTWTREELANLLSQQTIRHLHVANARIDELNVSAAMFRRLTSMAFTDGNIGKIVVQDETDSELKNSQFPKHSSIACLNISNNNLTSGKLEPLSQRPFAYLYNLTVLDASANNLTEFPLSLVQSNRKISVDFSGNIYLPCKHFQKAMEANNREANNSSLVTFLNYNNTYCAVDLSYNWFKDVQIVQIDHLNKQKALNESCRNIRPSNINCTCMLRMEIIGSDVANMVAVDCTSRNLSEMPTNLPPNTVKLNVSYNHIKSLQKVSTDPTYEHLRQLIVDYNDIESIKELEGTTFIDNFMLFSISHNKLNMIHTYVLSNNFDTISQYATFLIGGNYIFCDCTTEKVLKPWLQENFKYIPDYKSLMCQDGMGPVYELLEYQVCHTPRDWTDYIYYIIGLEVLILVLLISKVSYDYWVFKTAGYLPWPANKMPRLPCDWLCE